MLEMNIIKQKIKLKSNIFAFETEILVQFSLVYATTKV